MHAIPTGIDRERDPSKWNDAWEQYLEDRFRPLPSYPRLPLSPSACEYLLSEGYQEGIQAQRKALRQLQVQLAQVVDIKRTTDSLETKWLNTPLQTRRTHLLGALSTTCGSMAIMQDARALCPETTLKYLEEGGGKGFLNLIATICPQFESLNNIELRPEPIFISNRVFEAMLHIGEPCPPSENKDALEAFQQQEALTRNVFLTHFLWNMMLGIYGYSQEFLPVKTPRNSEMAKKFRALDPGAFKAIRQKKKEVGRPSERACENCKTIASDLAEGKSFWECTKCKAVGRKIVYCDKLCQLNDWKKGVPPHKQTCGKRFSIPDPITSTPTASVDTRKQGNQLPPTEPGFKRSDALLRQLYLQLQYPDQLYLLARPPPNPDFQYVGVKLVGSTRVPRFQDSKARAARNGDPQAVGMMCQLPVEAGGNVGISRECVIRQLSEEYGIDLRTIDKLSTPDNGADEVD